MTHTTFNILNDLVEPLIRFMKKNGLIDRPKNDYVQIKIGNLLI